MNQGGGVCVVVVIMAGVCLGLDLTRSRMGMVLLLGCLSLEVLFWASVELSGWIWKETCK